MKIFFKWTSIILLSVMSVFVYRAFQDSNDGILEDMRVEETKKLNEEKAVHEEELLTWQKPDEWFTYKNEEFAFLIDYSGEWETQESLKPTREYALHEINIHEKEYKTYRASFVIRIFEREGDQSVLEWWNTRLVLEDTKKQECIDKSGDDAPCLYLRDMVEAEEDIELAGQPAHKVQLFQFDHQEECVYIAKNKYIYGLCYDGSNPNDPDFEENKVTTNNMLKSFVFETSKLNKIKTEDIIYGTWKNVEDNGSIIIISSDGIYESIYNGKSMMKGKWSILEDGSLETIIDDEAYLYTILDLKDKKLSLSFVPRGNILEYVRIDEIEQ